MSAVAATSRPPPTQAPWMSATTGWRHSANACDPPEMPPAYCLACFELARSVWNAAMSAPLVAGAAQHDAAKRLVGVEFLRHLPELLPHGKRKRVQPLRIAQRDGRNRAVARDQDLTAHR
jgi:hypothetical protein